MKVVIDDVYVFVFCMLNRSGKSIIVHYKDKMVHMNDVDLNKYQVVDLYTDVRGLASRSGFVFPKFTRFQWIH